MALKAADRIAGTPGRLLDALADPSRRERTAFLLLASYAVVWSLYGAVAKSSQDIHFDMGEALVWSRAAILGSSVHPPLSGWVAGAWFSVFPAADWAYYTLAIIVATLGLWVAWKIAGRYLTGDKHAVGLALLTLVPFYNFHALKFNANSMLIPLWALTTWAFLRSYETRRPLHAALAGLAAAGAILCKYWSVFLLLGLALGALSDKRAVSYFRSAAPWITISAAVLAISPHVVSVLGHQLNPLEHALSSHVHSHWDAWRSALLYLPTSLAYCSAPILTALAATRPSPAALRDMSWPHDDDRRLIVVAFIAPLLLPPVVAVMTQSSIVALWNMAGAALLPVVLLSSPLVQLSRRAAIRILTIAIVVPVAALALSPLIAIAIFKDGVRQNEYATHYRLLAHAIDNLWRDTTAAPLRVVGSFDKLLYGVVFYLADRPLAFEHIHPAVTPWVDESRISRDGIALVCPIDHHECMQALAARTARVRTAKRVEVDISARYLGMEGAARRYVIVAIPPA